MFNLKVLKLVIVLFVLFLLLGCPNSSSGGGGGGDTYVGQPDLMISYNGSYVMNGGSVNLGSVNITDDTTTFSLLLTNSGDGTAYLEDTPSLLGGSGEIYLTVDSYSLSAGTTSSLNIYFDPNYSAVGDHVYSISATHRSPDGVIYYFTFSFTITVTGEPEVKVTRLDTNTEITDGGSTDFGSVIADSQFADEIQGPYVSFKVENIGDIDLEVSHQVLGGPDLGCFEVITSGLMSTVTPGGSVTFQIRFNPPSSGPKTSSVSFITNDDDEETFNFTLTGTGTAAAAE